MARLWIRIERGLIEKLEASSALPVWHLLRWWKSAKAVVQQDIVVAENADSIDVETTVCVDGGCAVISDSRVEVR